MKFYLNKIISMNKNIFMNKDGSMNDILFE